jgi:hypothetical protein
MAVRRHRWLRGIAGRLQPLTLTASTPIDATDRLRAQVRSPAVADRDSERISQSSMRVCPTQRSCPLSASEVYTPDPTMTWSRTRIPSTSPALTSRLVS